MKKLLTLTIPVLGVLMSFPASGESREKTLKASKTIDGLMMSELQAQNLVANQKVDDATFLRRAYINIAGRIPSITEVKSFLETKGKTKRYDLIDQLIESDDFKGKIFLFYADLLRLKTVNRKHGAALHTYLYDAAQSNKPYDEMVAELLSAEGHIAQNPAVGYMLRDEGMLLDSVSDTVQVFLGTQIGCAQCHDHPFEDVTQLDFYKIAAFSGGVRYRYSEEASSRIIEIAKDVALENKLNLSGIYDDMKSGELSNKQKSEAKKKLKYYLKKYSEAPRLVFKQYPRSELVDNASKELTLPHDYVYNDGKPHDVVKPGVFFGEMPKWDSNQDRRKAFADWVTNDTNPKFSKVIVNRLWANAFGYGLVEPLDDWTYKTKASYPKVLDFLANEMKANGYDLKQAFRTLYYTSLFQQKVVSVEPEKGESHDFVGPVLRRMSAVELYDSMMTLEKGEQINAKNKSVEERWENFVENYQTVANMNSKEVHQLGQTIQKIESAIREHKLQRNRLYAEINKAKGSGDDAKVAKLRKEKNKLDDLINKAYSTVMASSKMMGGAEGTDDSSKDSLGSLIRFSTKNNHGNFYGSGKYRASELAQPANAGSFIREFGGTDAALSNNSYDGASIPQVLEMLNGKSVKMIADKKGYLAELLQEAKSSKEMLDVLFLSIYSRYPTSREKSEFRNYTNTPKEMQNLVKAMINSKQFIFVQ